MRREVADIESELWEFTKGDRERVSPVPEGGTGYLSSQSRGSMGQRGAKPCFHSRLGLARLTCSGLSLPMGPCRAQDPEAHCRECGAAGPAALVLQALLALGVDHWHSNHEEHRERTALGDLVWAARVGVGRAERTWAQP